jgi:uncharacterized protein YabN with tetrapyrrole methylase and pyrophosphatase domain
MGKLKKNEKGDYSPLQNIPHILPALLRAISSPKEAAKVGFDWPGLEDVHEKMHEEIVELQKAEQSGNIESIKEEIGDLLFTSLISLAFIILILKMRFGQHQTSL